MKRFWTCCFLFVVLYATNENRQNISLYRDLVDSVSSERKASSPSHEPPSSEYQGFSQDFGLDEEIESRYEEFGYRSRQEMLDRHKRFPSVDERVKLYMSNWYLPPCKERVEYEYTARELLLQEVGRRTYQIDSFFNGEKIEGAFDNVHFMDPKTMFDCPHRYCTDTVQYLWPALNRTDIGETPILYQFGDDNRTRGVRVDLHHGIPKLGLQPHFPVIKKIRSSLTKDQLNQFTSSSQCLESDENPWHPIIFKLKTKRHYGRISSVPDFDIAWEEKKDTAIFRGAMNGKYSKDIELQIPNMTVLERCSLLPRCWVPLVYNNSTLVDSKLTRFPKYDKARMLPDTIEYNGNMVELNGEEKSFEELLQYKGLVMLEGNDVSSGLKWALYSNSVVLIPTPTSTSWAMEESLEPWVHYVPIDTSSTTDLDEKMQWVLDHPKEATTIARNGKLWIADLVLHPSAEKEEEQIFEEILRRYAQHFQLAKSPLPRREPIGTINQE